MDGLTFEAYIIRRVAPALLILTKSYSKLLHAALKRLDQTYAVLRAHLPTRKTFFDDLRALTRYLYFDSWDHLFTFMLEGLELEIPPISS